MHDAGLPWLLHTPVTAQHIAASSNHIAEQQNNQDTASASPGCFVFPPTQNAVGTSGLCKLDVTHCFWIPNRITCVSPSFMDIIVSSQLLAEQPCHI
jgi:hypothetical protein